MNISFLSAYNPNNVHKWSGTPYYMFQELNNRADRVDHFHNFQFQKGLRNVFQLAFYKSIGKKFDYNRTDFVLKQYAKNAEKLIMPHTDVVFSPSSLFFPYLKTNKKKVFYTDASFAGILELYPSFSNFCKSTINSGNRLEALALHNCNLAVYSSDWAAKTAIDHYGVNPEKVKVVPFGANIESSRDLAYIKRIVEKRSTNECHLLWCGVDWERKRGEFAVNVARILNKNGLKTILHILGINDIPEKNVPDFVINHGFISKSTDRGKNKINQLFSNAHFLLVPTLAEAYGLVFAEASSFGLPSVSTDVGGVSTVIKNDLNGKIFSLCEPELQYAEYIENMFRNQASYKELCLSSFHQYESRLNWGVSAKTLISHINNL